MNMNHQRVMTCGAVIVTVFVGALFAACASSSQQQPDILRDGPRTDVYSAYWESYLRDHGQHRTFVRFAERYEEVREQDAVEADRALDGFRRFCKLNRCLNDFAEYWSSRAPGAPAAATYASERPAPGPKMGRAIDTRKVGDIATGGFTETLYRSDDHGFFLYVVSGPESQYAGAELGEWLSDAQARSWLQTYSTPEKLATYFP